MLLQNSSSLHSAARSRAAVGSAKSSVVVSCSRPFSSSVARSAIAAPGARSSKQRFERLIGRVAEAERPPAEAADVQIDLNNEEDPQYTVSRACWLRRWQSLGRISAGQSASIAVPALQADALLVSACRCCTCQAQTGLVCSQHCLLL